MLSAFVSFFYGPEGPEAVCERKCCAFLAGIIVCERKCGVFGVFFLGRKRVGLGVGG